jgi:hypothetical protein
MYTNHRQPAHNYRDRQYIQTQMGNTSPVADRVYRHSLPKTRVPKVGLLKIVKLLHRIASFRYPVLRIFL